jgi:hypothetical protein
MSIRSWCLALGLTLAAGCMDWSLDRPKIGPIDCTRFNDAAQRYPGVCFPDGGTIDRDAGDSSDGGVPDGGVSDGDAAPPPGDAGGDADAQ